MSEAFIVVTFLRSFMSEAFIVVNVLSSLGNRMQHYEKVFFNKEFKLFSQKG
jgi:hypothetical protein